MERAGLEVDVYTYGVLMRGLCEEGNLKDAWKLFESMSEKKQKPSNVIYDTMIYGHCKEGSSYRALRLVKEMRDNSLVLNVASYGLTIRLLVKDGKLREAEALLNEMVLFGLPVSDSICRALYDAKMRSHSNS
uniref:Pentatricopeptide repeat-containing protein n=1 Tax=Ananas comosus var. bracteatus TaxID=296719 RepID=A0A6V7NUS2_ANACO|nr:unnamed protein product [Ananas comosus var. bracteatus]